MLSEKCLVDSCSNQAVVFCTCKSSELYLCETHGYKHYLLTNHDLKDITWTLSTLRFLDSDYSLLTGTPISHVEIAEGPSYFRKNLLKHLKNLPENHLNSLKISNSLKHLLFENSFNPQCLICGKSTKIIKLHLFFAHKMDTSQRKSHWDEFSEFFLNLNLTKLDIV